MLVLEVGWVNDPTYLDLAGDLSEICVNLSINK